MEHLLSDGRYFKCFLHLLYFRKIFLTLGNEWRNFSTAQLRIIHFRGKFPEFLGILPSQAFFGEASSSYLEAPLFRGLLERSRATLKFLPLSRTCNSFGELNGMIPKAGYGEIWSSLQTRHVALRPFGIQENSVGFIFFMDNCFYIIIPKVNKVIVSLEDSDSLSITVSAISSKLVAPSIKPSVNSIINICNHA